MLFMFFYRVVIWLPAFQLLEAEETLSQVGLVLSWTVDEAGRGHSLRGAGAALQEGPVLKCGDTMVLEVELPGRGQRRGTHPAAAERCRDSNPAVVGRRGACRERAARGLLGNGKLGGAGYAGSCSPPATCLCFYSPGTDPTPPRVLPSQLLINSGTKRSGEWAEVPVIVSWSGTCRAQMD